DRHGIGEITVGVGELNKDREDGDDEEEVHKANAKVGQEAAKSLGSVHFAAPSEGPVFVQKKGRDDGRLCSQNFAPGYPPAPHRILAEKIQKAHVEGD